MLANLPHGFSHSGLLGRDVHLPGTFLLELLNFIKDELPRWRDRDDRRKETSETALTSQLCGHLNSAARRASGWDILQFRTEEPDEQSKGRKVDLVPAPCDTVVWVEGRRYIDFDPLLPIECKRLPTPSDPQRDEREYVISKSGSVGGIQRFKAGYHGGNHNLGAMIAYVQQETREFWNMRIAEWIKEIAGSGQVGWTEDDLLHLDSDDAKTRLAVLRSSHSRVRGLPEIELRHLWVQMN
jgi:hypothetical protein